MVLQLRQFLQQQRGDDVRSCGERLAMACIEEDLGAPVDDIFEQLDRDPISAASLGQVHKGTLKGGARVAVKVQRPGLRCLLYTSPSPRD